MYRHGDMFKHEKHKDICYEYIKSYGPYNGKLKIKFKIWNMGYTKSFLLMANVQNAKFDMEKLKTEYKWLNREDQHKCFRDGNWK